MKDIMDIRKTVTDSIITMLETKAAKGCKSRWFNAGLSMPSNATTKAKYRGANVLGLWFGASDMGYEVNQWLTFKQGQALGGTVRKGERGQLCSFYSEVVKKGETDTMNDVSGNGATVEGQTVDVYSLIKPFWVFNVAQFDGLNLDIKAPAYTPNDFAPLEAAEAIITASGAVIEHEGTGAYFNVTDDKIRLPNKDKFHSAGQYYATAMHELIHWTGHKSRLDRNHDKRGTKAYAFEELVAEIGAAFFGAELGIFDEMANDHASYVGDWLEIMKADKGAIFTAAAQAAKACDYLMGKGTK
jgi:antirestriction protein ArdC